ncbi:GxxExxY protein [Horticoccus sp. 23ND18S-11]|uniref:GxxExxY protein n=1 Tax=Horticoccus sp. 23ND18S-11 TaxID=3391832 RepID=UPI0039C8D206
MAEAAANSDLCQQEGYDFMAAAFDVYNELGSGFLEEVYQESLELELVARKMPFVSKPALSVYYRGTPLQKHYYPDLIVLDQILVELKAVKTAAPEHEAQLLNYLKATRKRVGYLLNFGASPRLQWKRFVL